MGKDGFLSKEFEKLKAKDPKWVIPDSTDPFGSGLRVQATFVEIFDQILGLATVINLTTPGYTTF